MKAVAIGSLTLDLFFSDPSLTVLKNRFFLAIGGKYVVEDFSQGLGGGGANIAIGLSRLGIETTLWSEVGKGSVSKIILEKLKHEGVVTKLLETRDDFTNISAILLSKKGERTIINHRSHQSNLTFNSNVKNQIRTSNLLYLGNMPEVSLEERTQVLEFAKENGIKTVLNLGVKDCRLGQLKLLKMLKKVDVLIVNRFELADMLSHQPKELFLNKINYQQELGLKEDSILVVTDGEWGSYAQTLFKIFYQKALQVDRVVDATGAGDAFTTGFIAGLLYEKDIQTSLGIAAKNSASVIKKINAQDGLLKHKDLFDKVV
jgi:sugar/nucleoside kinase (ribokinase family)